MFFTRWISIITLILYPILLNARQPAEIDKLVEQGRAMYRAADFKNAITKGFSVEQQSDEIKYNKGAVNGLLLIAKALAKSGEYGKSLEYANRAESYTDYLSAANHDKFSLQILQAEIYHNLGFYSLSKTSYLQAEATAMQVKDAALKNADLFHTYTNCNILFSNPDSQYMYYKKAYTIVNSNMPFGDGPVDQKDKARYLLYIMIGEYHEKKQHADSASWYFKQVLDEMAKNGPHYYEIYAQEGIARLADAGAYYADAIEHYGQALGIAKKSQNMEDIGRLYLGIARVYGKLGESQKEQEYKNYYNVLHDSLQQNKARGREKAIADIVSDHEKKLEQNNTRHRIFIALLITGIIIFIGSLYFMFRKYKNRKEYELFKMKALLQAQEKKLAEKISETHRLQETVQQSAKELEKKDQESHGLQLRVNEAIDDLLVLARENHPLFYTRFQELYPSLHIKLLQLAPDLRLSELTLCAYIYLDFTTKEIADCTFRSIRTIQTRKFNLRKKLGIGSEQDTQIFIKSLLNYG